MTEVAEIPDEELPWICGNCGTEVDYPEWIGGLTYCQKFSCQHAGHVRRQRRNRANAEKAQRVKEAKRATV